VLIDGGFIYTYKYMYYGSALLVGMLMHCERGRCKEVTFRVRILWESLVV